MHARTQQPKNTGMRRGVVLHTPDTMHRQERRQERFRRWQDCAIDGRVIIGTVASASFDRPLQRLVVSAARVFGARFRCVAAAVMGSSDFVAMRDRRIAPLPPPPRPLLPRPLWCGDSRYGWRRSHLFRARMWRLVLAARFDLLAVDLDWYFVSDPLPGLAAARENRARLSCTGHPTGTHYLECVARSWAAEGVVAEVVALHDGGQLKTLNVGLMFVRATDTTVALARRVENRTRGGWEQGVFNEEASWGLHAGREVGCCHPPGGYGCDLARHFVKDEMAHGLGRNGHTSAAVRVRSEGSDHCTAASELPPSAPPPNSSRLRWAAAGARVKGAGWAPSEYNELKTRRLGRCSDLLNLCQGCAAR